MGEDLTCPAQSALYNGSDRKSCVSFFHKGLNFTDSRVNCERNYGGRLLEVNSMEVQSWMEKNQITIQGINLS